ncbi:MAG: T9SS type A sorting domain-containing protein [Saprospiraceae bacterium]|nr:T9SS type A sorting domain-containing protein [Saprospiraceae bacterium]
MQKLLPLYVLCYFGLFSQQNLLAQCQPDETEVHLIVETDTYGYETFWSLVSGGNACNAASIATGGNTSQVGCFGGGQQDASPGLGYGNNTMVELGPWCLKTDSVYTLFDVDDWGDGGATFTIVIGGYPIHHFKSTGTGGQYDFTVKLPLAFNAELSEIGNYSFNDLKPTTVNGELFNMGASAITTIDISYSVDGNAPQTETLTGLNVDPFTHAHFYLSTPWTPADTGNYQLKVWLANINGNADLFPVNDTLGKAVYFRSPIPFLLDHYLTDSVVINTIGTSFDGLDKPSDLAFAPTPSPTLWVVNRKTESSGGSTVTYFNAGLPTQDPQEKKDQNSWHFMSLPTGIAFSYNGNFATSPGVLDANHQGGGSHFTGPALWSSDWSVYAEPSGGNGSHLDMLHQSPYSMGIEWEEDNVFWVYDGYNKNIVRYDFQEDHGPGNDDHADGIVRRFVELEVERVDNTVSNHMALDRESGHMYIVDNGNKRVLRLDINSGEATEDLTPYAEPLAEYTAMTGTDWSVYIDSLNKPSGIAVLGDYLLVTDYGTGEIIFYDRTGAEGAELGRYDTGPGGIMGIEISPDGKIWYVNTTQSKVYQLDYTPFTVAANEPGNGPEFSISPNPTEQIFMIRLGTNYNAADYRLRVLDALGQVVRDESITSNTVRVDLGDQNAGYYFVQILNEKGSRTERVLLLPR